MSKKGCVYFVRQNGGKPVKVGYTSNDTPEKRIKQLSTGSPYGVYIVGYIKSDRAYELEQEIHAMCNHLRLDGEWFMLTDDTIDKLITYYSDGCVGQEFVKKRHKIDRIIWENELLVLNEIKEYNNLLDEVNATRYNFFQPKCDNVFADLYKRISEKDKFIGGQLKIEFK